MQSRKILTLNDVTIGYGDKAIATGISASINSGTLTCLIGCNGAGKSTLMRTIGHFQPALGGTLLIDNKDISSISPADCARLIGVVLTSRTEVQNMTVREMTAMGRAPYSGFWGRLSDEDHSIIDSAMSDTGIQQFAQRMIHTLSDGERQKVMIAKALAQQTPLLLLDEPTAFLDYPSKVDTMLMLQRLCHEQQKAVLISTHDLDIALKYCDQIWMMQDGKLLVGTKESLSQHISAFMRKEG